MWCKWSLTLFILCFFIYLFFFALAYTATKQPVFACLCHKSVLWKSVPVWEKVVRTRTMAYIQIENALQTTTFAHGHRAIFQKNAQIYFALFDFNHCAVSSRYFRRNSEWLEEAFTSQYPTVSAMFGCNMREENVCPFQQKIYIRFWLYSECVCCTYLCNY